MRIRLPLPDQPRKYTLPAPRFPASGHSLFWQQKCSIGCLCTASILNSLSALPLATSPPFLILRTVVCPRHTPPLHESAVRSGPSRIARALTVTHTSSR